jgi:plasmid stabilization system protein ParE
MREAPGLFLRFLPEVSDDAAAASAWYEEQASGLGKEFLRVFYACCERIHRNPELQPQVHGRFRRSLLRRFPFAVYYLIEKEQVVVYGVFHCARDPRRVLGKLGQRQDAGDS